MAFCTLSIYEVTSQGVAIDVQVCVTCVVVERAEDITTLDASSSLRPCYSVLHAYAAAKKAERYYLFTLRRESSLEPAAGSPEIRSGSIRSDRLELPTESRTRRGGLYPRTRRYDNWLGQDG